jgi:hypothetical protein
MNELSSKTNENKDLIRKNSELTKLLEEKENELNKYKT